MHYHSFHNRVQSPDPRSDYSFIVLCWHDHSYSTHMLLKSAFINTVDICSSGNAYVKPDIPSVCIGLVEINYDVFGL